MKYFLSKNIFLLSLTLFTSVMYHYYRLYINVLSISYLAIINPLCLDFCQYILDATCIKQNKNKNPALIII